MLYGVELFAIMRRPFKAIKREVVDEFERRYLMELLEQHHYNVSAVVRISGLSRRHVCALIRKHNEHLQQLRGVVVDP